ncbi:olfactory receptor 12D3-like [Podarcis muralis]
MGLHFVALRSHGKGRQSHNSSLPHLIHGVLQTPMYFFIGNLASIDIFYFSTTVPKVFVGLASHSNRISFAGRIAQMFFFHFLGSTEAMLLSIMGYDRYLAICHPLHYPVLMNRQLRWTLAALVWTAGFFHSLLHAIMMSQLSFCQDNKVEHFFCDISPLLALSCSDTWLNEALLAGVTGSTIMGCFALTLTSYALILRAVVAMRSAKGLQRAFSTCGAHLTVVALHYCSAGAMHLRPHSEGQCLVLTIFNLYSCRVPQIDSNNSFKSSL